MTPGGAGGARGGVGGVGVVEWVGVGWGARQCMAGQGRVG